ncbi:hypothetical protein SAMN05443582_10556 [Phyllobacterium sp. OV277]|nr:hypothetical protein SAMN05443582_10556 [Phyllobacterium sp. OV277]
MRLFVICAVFARESRGVNSCHLPASCAANKPVCLDRGIGDQTERDLKLAVIGPPLLTGS